MNPPDTNGPRWQARFFTLWSGQTLSLVGSALVRFALIWWLTEETGSVAVLGALLMALLPIEAILFSQWAPKSRSSEPSTEKRPSDLFSPGYLEWKSLPPRTMRPRS